MYEAPIIVPMKSEPGTGGGCFTSCYSSCFCFCFCWSLLGGS